MKVYIDIFFFVNFLMNLQVFQILNYWRRKPAVSARSIAGAGLGALLGVLVVILGIRTRWILWILVYAAGTSILIRFVYGKMNFRGHLRCVVGFYLTAAAVSGTLFGIREFLGLHSISLFSFWEEASEYNWQQGRYGGHWGIGCRNSTCMKHG